MSGNQLSRAPSDGEDTTSEERTENFSTEQVQGATDVESF